MEHYTSVPLLLEAILRTTNWQCENQDLQELNCLFGDEMIWAAVKARMTCKIHAHKAISQVRSITSKTFEPNRDTWKVTHQHDFLIDHNSNNNNNSKKNTTAELHVIQFNELFWSCTPPPPPHHPCFVWFHHLLPTHSRITLIYSDL